MRNTVIIAAACSLMATINLTAEETEAQAKPETYLVVKHYDHAKKLSYKMLAQSEYKAMLDEIASETKLWDKAMAAAEKAWKADSTTAKKTFPRTATSPVKVTIVDRFTDQAKAADKLTALETSLAEDEENNKKRADDQKARRTQNNPNTRKKPDDKSASDREALYASARSLFESKLAEIASGSTEKQEAAAPEPAEAPAKKKQKK